MALEPKQSRWSSSLAPLLVGGFLFLLVVAGQGEPGEWRSMNSLQQLRQVVGMKAVLSYSSQHHLGDIRHSMMTSILLPHTLWDAELRAN
jgi:hypothetical protein